MPARASSPAADPSWTYAPEEYGSFGSIVASAGDVNGDGVGDVIIGSPDWSDGSMTSLGRAYLFLGQCGQDLAAEPAWIAQGAGVDGSGTFLGSDVGSAGDVNGDGFGDIFVVERHWWAPGSSACEASNPNDCADGRVHVWYGGPTGPAVGAGGMAAAADWIWAPGWWAEGIAGVAAGDVNGDGISDLAVGVPDAGAGHVRVFHGAAATGLPARASVIVDAPPAPADLNFGEVIAIGDVDGDSFDDLLTGAHGAFDLVAGHDFSGVAYLYYGSAGGLQATPGWTR